MATKNDIIARCRASIKKRYDRPSIDMLSPTVYPDVHEKFVAQAEGAAACKVVSVESLDEVDRVIADIYPDAKVIASALPEVKSATVNPDTVADARDLNGTDVGVVRAYIGVAENGSVWIPQQVKERDVCFISENLVAVLKRDSLVNNMHEAYARITKREYGAADFEKAGYGVFIAGPSKTADIAQVLVNGAQAARSMTIVLVP